MIDGPNEYTYVNQNPWTHFDPEGLNEDAANYFSNRAALYQSWKKESIAWVDRNLRSPVDSGGGFGAPEILEGAISLFDNGVSGILNTASVLAKTDPDEGISPAHAATSVFYGAGMNSPIVGPATKGIAGTYYEPSSGTIQSDTPVQRLENGGQALLDYGTMVLGAKLTEVTPGSRGGPGAGKDFTPKTKGTIATNNATANGGTPVCVNCQKPLIPAKQSVKGVPRPDNEIQIDHIYPKAKGGNNTEANGQALCPICNNLKSDTIPPSTVSAHATAAINSMVTVVNSVPIQQPQAPAKTP
jgi:hypothetical protein